MANKLYQRWFVGLLAVFTSLAGCGMPDTEVANSTATGDPTSIRPFEIHVPDEVLTDLDRRLLQTRFPDQIGGSWVYGTDVGYLKELVTYWRDEYDWREQELHLNTFDHYQTLSLIHISEPTRPY